MNDDRIRDAEHEQLGTYCICAVSFAVLFLFGILVFGESGTVATALIPLHERVQVLAGTFSMAAAGLLLLVANWAYRQADGITLFICLGGIFAALVPLGLVYWKPGAENNWAQFAFALQSYFVARRIGSARAWSAPSHPHE